MASTLKYEFQLKHFGFTDCEPHRFYQSQWFENRWIFWGIKLIFLAYWFGWFVAGFIILPDIERWWIFLTNWGVTIHLIYFLASFSLATYGLFTAPTSSIQTIIPRPPPTVSGKVDSFNGNANAPTPEIQWFHNFVWIFHQLAFGVALIITVAFYTLLRPNFTALSINTHAINLVIMILDLSISHIPIRLLHFYHVSFAGIVYTVFSLILHGTGYESSIYPNVLDWTNSSGFSIGMCLIIILVIAPVVQLIAYGLYQLRSFIGRKTCGSNHTAVTSSANDHQIELKGKENLGFTP